MRVELVGGMGCGKTTLAKELAKLGAVHVKEYLDDNPFLKDCYRDFDTFKFPSQMWFGLTKFREIGLYDCDDEIYIHDQAVINNNAYTNLLFPSEFDERARLMIQQTFDYTEEVFGLPDRLIWIHCDPKVQLERIKIRGREHEKNVDLAFLINLKNCITELMTQADKKGYNILEIHSDTIDFSQDKEFVESLWEILENQQGAFIEEQQDLFRSLMNAKGTIKGD